MDATEAFEEAQRAVHRLAAVVGPQETFPFDRIWEHAAVDVPSTSRPATAKKLVRQGYLEDTGRRTRAISGPRAGSPTTEYRLGPRLRPGPATGGASPSSTGALLRAAHAQLAAEGLVVTLPELANVYLALKTSPLVILAGRSGTGKGLLPRRLAELVDADFTAIPVGPQWSDSADLLGYTPTLTPDRFVPGPLTRVLERAAAAPDRLHLVTLDEMNLAHVEHYFSDVLSVAETRRRVGGQTRTDALRLDLPPAPPGGPDPHAALRGLGVPPNVRVVGSANMDETARPFSPRVLDRAFTIEFDEVDLAAFATGAPAAGPDLRGLAARIVDPANPVTVTEGLATRRDLFESVGGLLGELNTLLDRAGVGFAYRTRDAICLYLWHHQEDGLDAVLPLDVAVDLCILQKVLPRVRGQGGTLARVLDDLVAWLEQAPDPGPPGTPPLRKAPYTRSAAKARQMKARLDEEFATSFWSQ